MNLQSEIMKKFYSAPVTGSRFSHSFCDFRNPAPLVNTFHEIGFTRDHRLAILHSGDPHRRARTFAFLSRIRGWMVRAFGDFEEAIYWLSAPEKPAPKQAAGRRLPVTDVSDETSFVRRYPEQHRSLRVNRQH